MIINNNKDKIITGIDIGTTKIAIIIAEKTNDSINILGFGESESKGLRRGVVIDINDTATSIEKALNIAEEQANIEVQSAFIGITGEHVSGVNCTGSITISNNEYSLKNFIDNQKELQLIVGKKKIGLIKIIK